MSKYQNPAMYRYTWPGQPEKRVCFDHARVIEHVAKVMDFYLQLIILKADEIMIDSQCHQEEKEIHE